MATLNLPVLKLINESRSTYGLRHQDFGRYQSHCATKVQHLRKSVGLEQVTSKAKKYLKKDVTAANATTDKHLQIVLFDAERAWAHSQLLKSTLSNPDVPPATKHHLARRLGRAVLKADYLFSLVTSLGAKVSVADRAQCAAYFLTMKGSLAFEQGKHQDGLNALSVAQSLLERIAGSSDTAHGEALANEMIDEIEPMLRFCAYTLQLDISKGTAGLVKSTMEKQKDALVKGYDELVRELEQRGGRIRRETVELNWRGKDIPVRNAQLVTVVLKVKTALKGLAADKEVARASSSKKKGEGRKEVMGARRMGTYDKALLVLSEGEEIARQLVEDNKIASSRSTSTRSDATSAALQQAHAYIVYQLLSIRTKRDLLLIDDTQSKLASRETKIRAKEADFVSETGAKDPKVAETKIKKQRARVYPGLVKVYDGIVLNLEQMRDLEAVEQDGDLAATVEARIAFVKASRALYISRSYALVDQFPSALSLNSRGKLYAREARSLADSLDTDDYEDVDFVGDLLALSASEFDQLDKDLAADSERAGHDWYAATGGKVDVEPEDLEVEGMDLEGGKKVKKEAFYDIAYSYVAAFDIDAIARKAGLAPELAPVVQEDVKMAVEEEVEVEQQSTPKKGWGFGLFGRR